MIQSSNFLPCSHQNMDQFRHVLFDTLRPTSTVYPQCTRYYRCCCFPCPTNDGSSAPIYLLQPHPRQQEKKQIHGSERRHNSTQETPGYRGASSPASARSVESRPKARVRTRPRLHPRAWLRSWARLCPRAHKAVVRAMAVRVSGAALIRGTAFRT